MRLSAAKSTLQLRRLICTPGPLRLISRFNSSSDDSADAEASLESANAFAYNPWGAGRLPTKYGIAERMEKLGHRRPDDPPPLASAAGASSFSSNDSHNASVGGAQPELSPALASPQIASGDDSPPGAAGGRSSGLDAVAAFDRKPREVKDFMDRFVIGQSDAKKALAVALCDHYNHVRRCIADPEAAGRHYVKPNVLVLGPSGSGKTHLVRTVAQLVGVPFVKCDATKFR